MDTILTIRFEVAHAKTAEFRDMIVGVKQSLPGTKGCKTIDVLQSIDDPTDITLVERWRSTDDHKAHFEEIVASGAWETVKSMLRSEPHATYRQEL